MKDPNIEVSSKLIPQTVVMGVIHFGLRTIRDFPTPQKHFPCHIGILADNAALGESSDI
jgi:hypothetical protein